MVKLDLTLGAYKGETAGELCVTVSVVGNRGRRRLPTPLRGWTWD